MRLPVAVKIALVVGAILLAVPIAIGGLIFVSWKMNVCPELIRPPTQGGTVGNWQVNNRLRQRFPIGSDAAVLVAHLKKDKYKIDIQPGQNRASASCPGFPCGGEVWVYWTEDGERKLLDVRGNYSSGCL
jgi:hypothetical protein